MNEKKIINPFGHLIARLFQDDDVSNVYKNSSLLENMLPAFEIYRDAWQMFYYCCTQEGGIPIRDVLVGQGYPPLLDSTPFPLSMIIDAIKREYLVYQTKNVVNSLKFGDKDLDDIVQSLEHLSEQVIQSLSGISDMDSIDIRQGWSLYEKYRFESTISTSLLTGWDSFDKNSIGLRKGDLVSFSGRPGAGKTWLMLKCAHNMWHQGASVMFITMEIDKEGIFARSMAIETLTPVRDLSNYEITEINHPVTIDIMKGLGENKNPFNVVGGEIGSNITSIVSEVKKVNPDVLFVDGAYMLGVESKRFMPEFEKIGEIATMLKKDIAMGCKIPVVASWQMNRQATVVKQKDVSLEHIAGSDKIGQFSSSVVLISAKSDEEAHSDSVRTVRVIKGRNGETGKFDINFDMQRMDFSEVDEDAYGQCENI